MNNTKIINNAITKLSYFAKEYGIDSLFIIGSYCRNMYWGHPQNTDNLEVVSAFRNESLQLGEIFATEILNVTPKKYPEYDSIVAGFQDGTQNIEIEFQSISVNPYMHNQEINNWLQKQGFEDIPIMNNIFGRDFTVNAILFSLQNEHMYDPTGRAIPDLEDKKISSLLPPEMLIKYSPVSAFRAIRLSLQYDCIIDANLRIAMQESYQSISNSVSKDRIMENIVRILKEHGTKGLELLKKYNLTKFLLIPEIKDLI